MKLAIMQPYIFPYIGYFQLLNYVDKFVIYDDVNYINKGWINRNNILVSNRASLFTIPLMEASQNKLIKEIEIVKENKWKLKFLKTIHGSYVKAPLFEIVYPIIEKIILFEERNISKYILNSLKEINLYLDIQTELVSTSSIYKNSSLNGQYRILDICRIEAANEYINPIGGKDLYSKEAFTEQNIQLYFIKSKEIKYKQLSDNFIPFLSMIDVLMFNKKSEVISLLKEHELIQ
jgi:hypothetical protein